MSSATPSPAPAAAPVHQAPPPDQLPTTDATIALGSLEGDISVGEQRLSKEAPTLPHVTTLAELLMQHGQFLGILADYARASQLGDQAVELAPQDGQAHILRAKTLALFHHFSDALQELAHGEDLLHDPHAGDRPRASILQALGRYDEALVIAHRLSQQRPHISTLGNEASLLADMGETEQAEEMFIEAQLHFPDVSPFPLAWVWFQEGQMWEKKGKPSRARLLYEQAIARLPSYAHAVSHLASLEPPAAAIGLLRPIVASSDDPAYSAQLGTLLRESGERSDGDKLVASARARYQVLTKTYPEAFADHAARFFAGPGGEPQTALIWARKNVEARPTPDAYILLLDVSTLAKDPRAGCDAASAALQLPHVPDTLRAESTRLLGACGEHQAATRPASTPIP